MARRKNVAVSKRMVLRDPVCLLAFGLGLGLAPVAPGTFGTLLGIPIYLWISGATPLSYGLAVGLLFAVGIPLCSACERRLGAQGNTGELTPSPHGGRLGWGCPKSSEASDLTRPHPNPPPMGEGAPELNSTALAVQDHSGIVWDEIVGFLITMSGVEPTWRNIALGFALFRLFDVLKPWPIRLIDRNIHGGLGIMLDDLLAGVFGWAALQVLQPLLS